MTPAPRRVICHSSLDRATLAPALASSRRRRARGAPAVGWSRSRPTAARRPSDAPRVVRTAPEVHALKRKARMRIHRVHCLRSEGRMRRWGSPWCVCTCLQRGGGRSATGSPPRTCTPVRSWPTKNGNVRARPACITVSRRRAPFAVRHSGRVHHLAGDGDTSAADGWGDGATAMELHARDGYGMHGFQRVANGGPSPIFALAQRGWRTARQGSTPSIFTRPGAQHTTAASPMEICCCAGAWPWKAAGP